MSQPVKTRLGRKALKTAGIVLVWLAGIFLVVLVLLYLMAEPIVARYLKKQVALQTGELYQVSFDDLQLHLRTRSIILQELYLYPDTTVHSRQRENGTARRSLFKVQCPSLKVTGINLVGLLLDNRLSIKAVEAEHPLITQMLDESVEKARGPGSKGSSGTLEAVSILELDIQEASYRCLVMGQQNRPRHMIPLLSLHVQDLRLDLQEQEDITSLLRAGAAELDIQNYAYHSPDSLYAIQAGRISYSSGQQTLKAENIVVQPDLRINPVLPKHLTHRMVYQLSIPLLYMRGLNVAEAWCEKQLQLDQLLLERTALHILEDLTVPDTITFPELAGLYASLSPYLREIRVKEFHLADGSFSYRQKSSTVHTVHRLDKANINLQALQLDSATLFTTKEKPFAGAIQLATGNYTYSPRYSPYILKAGSIKLSTREKTLQADSLHLVGDWGKNDDLKRLNKARRALYDIKLPHLAFHDIDLLQALRTSRLAIGSIATAQPMMDMRIDQLVKKQDAGPDLQELYQQVSGIVNRLEVGEVTITDATLTQHSKTSTIQLLQQLEHASLSAAGLEIDSAFIFNPDEKLPLQDIFLSARSYRYYMPDNTYTFNLAGLRYSTHLQELTARSLSVISSTMANDRQKIFHNASRNLFDLSASALQVTGLDVIKALNSGRLEADTLLLRRPDVAMLLDRTVAASAPGQRGDTVWEGSGLIGIISVNTIRLEDGSFTFNEKLEPVMQTHLLEHATATVSGFELRPASFANLDDALPVQEMTLFATDYTFLSTDSLYTIRLDSVHYSSKQQEIVARTLRVSADREVNERLKAESPDLASRNLVGISAKRSRITGFNLIRAYATGQYHMSSLLFEGPEVTILQDHNVPLSDGKVPAGQDTAATVGAIQQLTNMVTTFRVGRVQITDGIFNFHILEDTIRMSQTLEHVALAIDQLRLVSLEANDPLDIFDADDIRILVQGYTFFTPDSLYALEVKEIKASMHSKSLSADSLRLRPLYSIEAYATLFPYARDRIDLAVPGIEMQGISLRALFNKQAIVAQKMLVRNPAVEIYRDNRLGLDPELRPPTLQNALRGAGLYIRLDTILVEKNYLVHPIIAKDGIKPAVFLLDNIRMQAYNVTNDTALIRRNNMLTVNASALFMGVSTLNTHFRFQMDHPEDRYTYEGTLGQMDFSALNPLLENMLFVRIKSGRINNASFRVEATGKEAIGQIHFPYNNLKVQLLDKSNPENPRFLLKVGSRLANALIIKSNNPSAWGRFREGDIREERDPKRSLSYHISQSMFDGVTSSLMTKPVKWIVSRFVEF